MSKFAGYRSNKFHTGFLRIKSHSVLTQKLNTIFVHMKHITYVHRAGLIAYNVYVIILSVTVSCNRTFDHL